MLLHPVVRVHDIIDACPKGKSQRTEFDKDLENIVMQRIRPVDEPLPIPHVHKVRNAFKAQSFPQRRELIIVVRQAPEHVAPHHIDSKRFQKRYKDAGSREIQVQIEKQKQSDTSRQNQFSRTMHPPEQLNVNAHQKHRRKRAALQSYQQEEKGKEHAAPFQSFFCLCVSRREHRIIDEKLTEQESDVVDFQCAYKSLRLSEGDDTFHNGDYAFDEPVLGHLE